jgi:NAD kinase
VSEDKEEKLDKLMTTLKHIDQAEMKYRDRLAYEVQRADKVVNYGLALNEVVLGGHDGAK